MDQPDRTDVVEHTARQAVDWLTVESSRNPSEPSLYAGQAGVLLALHEAAVHFADDSCAAALDRALDRLVAAVDTTADSSLYFGLAGLAGTLRAFGRHVAADRALQRIRDRFDGTRWNPMFELLGGNAGIGLGALWAGDVELALTAVTPYLRTFDRTPGGVNWPVRPSPPRSHHMAHGTLGIAVALATIGRAADSRDLIELAVEAATDVVSRNEATDGGFVVPHSDPPHRPDLIERYSLGWCNGPAGDAQAFRLLGAVTGDGVWAGFADACWRTITSSGLPARLRPGFWDNNGRCCGTAGVLALACDRIVELNDDAGFADVLVDDLVSRATVDGAGPRWSNLEHRSAEPGLDPQAGWAMGNAGIVRELLRYVRVRRGRGPGYAVQWPDHPVAVTGVA